MKAELKFKRTDNNQTPEVVTYHTDTIDVSVMICVNLFKVF